MSKILMINGSPNETGCTYTALAEVGSALQKEGVDYEILWLGKKPVADCIGCYKCFELGKCVFNDLVNETAARWEEFDGIVVGSPVYFGGPTGRVCDFLTRFMFSAGDRFAGKLAAAVVSCRRGGGTSAFQRLNQFFCIKKMIIVGSQYWNQVHGFTPEDVKKDAEGLQTMRTLGQNMAWILKCREAGKKAGIQMPQYEEIQLTNFIR